MKNKLLIIFFIFFSIYCWGEEFDKFDVSVAAHKTKIVKIWSSLLQTNLNVKNMVGLPISISLGELKANKDVFWQYPIDIEKENITNPYYALYNGIYQTASSGKDLPDYNISFNPKTVPYSYGAADVALNGNLLLVSGVSYYNKNESTIKINNKRFAAVFNTDLNVVVQKTEKKFHSPANNDDEVLQQKPVVLVYWVNFVQNKIKLISSIPVNIPSDEYPLNICCDINDHGTAVICIETLDNSENNLYKLYFETVTFNSNHLYKPQNPDLKLVDSQPYFAMIPDIAVNNDGDVCITYNKGETGSFKYGDDPTTVDFYCNYKVFNIKDDPGEAKANRICEQSITAKNISLTYLVLVAETVFGGNIYIFSTLSKCPVCSNGSDFKAMLNFNNENSRYGKIFTYKDGNWIISGENAYTYKQRTIFDHDWDPKSFSYNIYIPIYCSMANLNGMIEGYCSCFYTYYEGNDAKRGVRTYENFVKVLADEFQN